MTDEYSKKYSPEVVQEMEDIIKLPSGAQRWRASVNAWLRKNEIDPISGLPAREYNALQLAYNKRLRDEQTNKFASTESGALRLGLSIPQGAWSFIKMFDPPAFNQASSSALVRANMKKLMAEFKEYVIPEKS